MRGKGTEDAPKPRVMGGRRRDAWGTQEPVGPQGFVGPEGCAGIEGFVRTEGCATERMRWGQGRVPCAPCRPSKRALVGIRQGRGLDEQGRKMHLNCIHCEGVG